jgi:diguanylate cyclase (GGDEF)-like protein
MVKINLLRRSAAVVIVGLVLVTLFSQAISQRVLDHALTRYAADTAMHWGEYLAEELTDLEAIIEGSPPSAQSLQLIEATQNVGDVFRFKLFNASGHLMMISDNLVYRYEGDAQLTQHNRQGADVLDHGEPYVEVQQGTGDLRPLHYAEAYVPLAVDGQTIGILEVYVDQTERRAAFAQSLSFLSYGLIGAMLIAFALPALAFLYRTLQQANLLVALDHISNHDGVTGMMNRTTFNTNIAKRMARGEALTVFSVDLDRFKTINETLDHGTGDAVLRTLAGRLALLMPEEGIMARLGGDEFAICIPRQSSSAEHCMQCAQALIGAIGQPFLHEDSLIQQSASVGFSTYPEHGQTPEELLKNADIALYRAKALGRGRAMLYDPSMDSERARRIALERRLVEALHKDEFELHYQPQFEINTGRLEGFEALLRLKDENGQPISPADFIPVAEEIGLIDEIGVWVLRRACAYASTWPSDLCIAVNLSAMQFESGDLPSIVGEVLAETGLPAQQLELEITESLLISDTDSVIKQLYALRKLGITIALDDFGAGYSSLAYLWRFPFDTLKLDRAFLSAINAPDNKSRTILNSIVSLGQILKMTIIAEGVETAEQLTLLRELGCNATQGFLLGRPLAVEDMPVFLLQHFRSAVGLLEPAGSYQHFQKSA